MKPEIQLLGYSCGTASLAMIYHALGIKKSEQDLIIETGLTAEGLSWRQMIENALSAKLYPVFMHHARIDHLKSGLSVVCWQKGDDGKAGSHFSPVLKIEPHKVLLADPSYGEVSELTHDEFEDRWSDDETVRALMRI